MATGYLAASLELGARQAEQARDLEQLSRERAAVSTSGRRLHGALYASLDSGRTGLHVFALGPLRAERDGELIRQWGGEKAGTRQAEALFAFLFDRGERGVTKDEAVELIWPDVDLDRADLAFHRTLGGLRRTLEPGRGQRQGSKAIGFSNDRYRLDPAVVSWTDVATFEQRLTDASAASDPVVALGGADRGASASTAANTSTTARSTAMAPMSRTGASSSEPDTSTCCWRSAASTSSAGTAGPLPPPSGRPAWPPTTSARPPMRPWSASDSRDRIEDRLGVAAAGVELVAEAGDAHRSAHAFEPRLERRPHVGRIVDPRRDVRAAARRPAAGQAPTAESPAAPRAHPPAAAPRRPTAAPP